LQRVGLGLATAGLLSPDFLYQGVGFVLGAAVTLWIWSQARAARQIGA
jgi:hypothetical protein